MKIMLEIKLFKDQNLKGYTLIEGFPGVGLVGPMACSYMVEKLDMEYVGYVESDQFPPIAVIHDGVPMFTARMYVDRKYKLVIMLSEFTIPIAMVYQLSMSILSFARKSGINRVISLGGMPSLKPAENAYLVSVGNGKKNLSPELKPINEGVVAGVSALLLAYGSQLGIQVSDILVEANPNVMDPKNAEFAISGLNKLLGINIDLKELEREAEEVEARVKAMLKKAKDTHEHYQKATEAAGPSMYA